MSITYLKANRLESCLVVIICFLHAESKKAILLVRGYLERDRQVKTHNLEGIHRSRKGFSMVPWLACAWSDTHFVFLVVKFPLLPMLFGSICLTTTS